MENNSNLSKESAKAYSPSRTVPRYRFVAVAELTDVASSRKISGEVEEISRRGCYMETMNVLPEGSTVDVNILRGQETFVTKGEVLYAHPRRGMGIVFVDTPTYQADILALWLIERASIVALI